jgi:hypothetical protein
MKQSVIIAFIVTCLLALPSSAMPDKKREWQEGKLIDIKSEAYATGTVLGGTASKERISYVIDAGQYTYTFSHLHFRHDKAMPVTVNAVIKFAIEKNKVYILDEDGKEHELKFEKKALKDDKK